MVRDIEKAHHGPLIAAGVLLGTGLGGFVDGIVLHQILQWHNMLSSVRPPTNLVDMKVNMVWDGLFHSLNWLVTAVGLTLLFRAGRRLDVPWSAPSLVGAMLGGWGFSTSSRASLTTRSSASTTSTPAPAKSRGMSASSRSARC